MASDLFDLLVRMTVASSVAIVAVLMLRAPLRRLAGARAAYGSWLLVPLTMLAAALPQMKVAPVLVMQVATPAASAMVATAMPASTDWAYSIMLAWSCGAFAALTWLIVNQLVFVQTLGSRDERDGIVFAERAPGPMLLGLWRQRIVVPADFASRYPARNKPSSSPMNACMRRGATRRSMACWRWFSVWSGSTRSCITGLRAAASIRNLPATPT